MDADRSQAFIAGVALLALSSLVNIGATFIPAGDNGPPPFIIWGGLVIGIFGVIAALALWQRHRWALWPAIVALVLGILGTVRDCLRSFLWIRIAALAWVIVALLSIVLLLLPRSRESLTA